MSMQFSTEYIRGHLHRHHSFDYHSIEMVHGETPYHDFLDGLVYEDIKKIPRGTKISSLVLRIHDVITQMHNYQLFYGPYCPDTQTWNYIIRNLKRKLNYSVSIKKDKSFSCNCPAYINSSEIPCKHIIIAALIKKHEIDLGEK